MNDTFSIWLIPTKTDEEYLNKVIIDLANKYHSPTFIPHLTLLSNTTLAIETLKSIVDETFKDIKPFKIKTTKLNQSEIFFKTVFIEFELDEILKNLFIVLSQKTDKRDLSTFKSHMSLIYKTMPEEERLKIIEMLKIKNELEIGKVLINKNDPNNRYGVNGWKIVYKKELI